MRLTNFIDILGMHVDMVQIDNVAKIMEGWIANRSFGNYIVISNINDVAVSKKDIKVREAVNCSSLSVPDGISLVILARIYGYRLKRRVYGPDLIFEFLEGSYDKGYSHFFYGSTPQTLDLLIKKLNLKFPNLKIAGFYSPPFRPLTEKEDSEIVEMINKSSPDVLWVGLGCPKQQLWMYEHKDKLKVPVMVGIGAAFDFLAGVKPQAPKFIRDRGFEWLFRLITEPKRLWRRYLIGGLTFLGFFLKEFISIKILKKKIKCEQKRLGIKN